MREEENRPPIPNNTWVHTFCNPLSTEELLCYCMSLELPVEFRPMDRYLVNCIMRISDTHNLNTVRPTPEIALRDGLKWALHMEYRRIYP